MKISALILIVGLGIAGLIYSQKDLLVGARNNTENSPALALMTDILNELDADVKPKAGELVWNDLVRQKAYPAHTFTINYSAADNARIADTWRVKGEIDKISISGRFEDELRERGFKLHSGNTGDATFSSVRGYIKNNIACVISGRITTPTHEVDYERSLFESYSTVTCGELRPAEENGSRG